MASKQIFEEVYTQKNIILCIKPQKVYLIEENMCSIVTGYTLIFRLWNTVISKVWDLATYHSAMRDRVAVSLPGYKCRGVAKKQAQPMDYNSYGTAIAWS